MWNILHHVSLNLVVDFHFFMIANAFCNISYKITDFYFKFCCRSIPLENLVAIVKRNFTLGVLIEEWVGPDDRNSLGHIIQVG